MREAVASLPKDAEITGGIDGPLRVNGKTNDDFHARGCPFETEIDGVEYIVDGTAEYDGFSNACAGLKFDGTITSVEDKKVYSFSFEYSHGSGDPDAEPDFDRLDSDLIDEDEDESGYAELTGIARGILNEYEFQYIE